MDAIGGIKKRAEIGLRFGDKQTNSNSEQSLTSKTGYKRRIEKWKK